MKSWLAGWQLPVNGLRGGLHLALASIAASVPVAPRFCKPLFPILYAAAGKSGLDTLGYKLSTQRAGRRL
jgi:hypothetical protein